MAVGWNKRPRYHREDGTTRDWRTNMTRPISVCLSVCLCVCLSVSDIIHTGCLKATDPKRRCLEQTNTLSVSGRNCPMSNRVKYERVCVRVCVRAYVCVCLSVSVCVGDSTSDAKISRRDQNFGPCLGLDIRRFGSASRPPFRPRLRSG